MSCPDDDISWEELGWPDEEAFMEDFREFRRRRAMEASEVYKRNRERLKDLRYDGPPNDIPVIWMPRETEERE